MPAKKESAVVSIAAPPKIDLKDILFKDRGVNYVFSDKTSLILHRPGKPLSLTHLVSRQTRNNRVLIRASLELAKTYYSPLRLKKSVGLTLTKKDNKANGKNNICLALEVFDHETYTPHEKADVFMGEFIHEAAHFLYTDFAYAKSRKHNKVQHSIHNIIEDEMIERKIAVEFPGYAEYLKRMRGYYFDEHYRASLSEWKRVTAIMKAGYIAKYKLVMEGMYEFTPSEDEVITQIEETLTVTDTFKDVYAERLHCLLQIIRYPLHLTDELIERNIDFIASIKDYLIPYPENSVACCRKAELIYEEWFKNDSEKDESGDGEESDDSDEGSGGKGKSKKSKKKPEQKEGGDEDVEIDTSGEGAEKNDDVNDEDSEAGDESGDGSKDEADKDGEGGAASIDDVAQKIVYVYGTGNDKEIADLNDALEDLPLTDLKKMITSVMQEEDNNGAGCEGKDYVGPATESKKAFFLPMNKRTTSAEKDAAYSRARVGLKANVIRNFLLREIRDIKLCVKSVRSGHLDANKLVEARLGVETVYQRFGEAKSKKVNAVLLVDQSGSMSCPHIDGRDRWQHARDIAAMFDLALSGIPDVNLFMYGYTSDWGGGSMWDFMGESGSAGGMKGHGTGTTDIFIYKEPGMDVPYSIGHMASHGNNMDHLAIREVGLRVRKFTDEPCIFIMVSDGEPAAYGYSSDEDGCMKVKKEVTFLIQKLNFDFVHVAIGEQSEHAKDMYPIILNYQDVRDLPSKIGQLMRKFVTKKLKATINI